MRHSHKDGAYYSLMVGAGETYLPVFALALQMGDVVSGLMATVPFAIGSFCQLFAGYGVMKLSSRRRWVLLCASIQSLALFAIAALALFPVSQPGILLGLASVYWSAGLAAGPAWNIWIGRLVPPDSRVRFFSMRSLITQVTTLIGLIVTGLLLSSVHLDSEKLEMFAGIFFLAGCLRLASLYHLWRQIELSNPIPLSSLKPKKGEIRRWMKNRQIALTAVYMFGMAFAVHIASPFFNPYMIQQLNFEYKTYMMVIGVACVAKIVSYPLLARLAAKFGVASLMIIGLLGLIPSPLLWIVSDHIAYLCAIQVIGGVAWGSYELGITLVLLENHNDQDRSRILTMTGFLSAIGMLGGSILGAQLLKTGLASKESYHLLFMISSILRFMPVVLLPYFLGRSIKVGRIFVRVIGVRPGIGAVMKPILYSEEKRKAKIEKKKASG